jgi:FdhD protein
LVAQSLACAHMVAIVPVVQLGAVPPVMGMVPQQTFAAPQSEGSERGPASMGAAASSTVPVSGLVAASPGPGAGVLLLHATTAMQRAVAVGPMTRIRPLLTRTHRAREQETPSRHMLRRGAGPRGTHVRYAPSPMRDACAEVPIETVSGAGRASACDVVAVEEPLEIRAAPSDGPPVRIAVTMRTPGDDLDLAAGFLFAEGIVARREQIVGMRHSGPTAGEESFRNVVTVDLAPGCVLDLARLERNFVVTSSCGVCGKASLEGLRVVRPREPARDDVRVEASVVHRLQVELRRAQTVFDKTGGLHAAALFDTGGALVRFREDVGRHNAVDKVLGASLLAGDRSLPSRVLFLSGRASFELVDKARVARVPIVAAVGAPSSLAVSLADEHGITLLGFVRDQRFNVYTTPSRIVT